MQRAEHASANEVRHDPNQRTTQQAAEQLLADFFEILVDGPAVVQAHPVRAFFECALNQAAQGTLRAAQPSVELVSEALLQIVDDDRRVAKPPALVLDVRDLALGSLARITGTDLVGNL